VTPENLKPSKPSAAFGSWEWEFEVEERSLDLDRLHEMFRREEAATRAVMRINAHNLGLLEQRRRSTKRPARRKPRRP
jgi:hypothetical protein